MKTKTSFIDELLEEAEAKEEKLNRELIDLVLIEIRVLQDQVEQNFEQAERERTIIKNWAINANDKLVNRIQWLEKRLEAWLKEEGKKTVDLPNGAIRFRKQPDRIEIVDEEMFFNNATSSILAIIPETAKADLNKIKAFIKRSGRTPKGCELVP
jgi:arginine deiminase